jgi:cytochrome c oxidase subunit 2
MRRGGRRNLLSVSMPRVSPISPPNNASSSRRWRSWFLLLFALAFLLVACAQNAPQDALDPQGPIAKKADTLWDITFGTAVVIFFIVEGLLVVALFMFRQKGAKPGNPVQIHHNTKLEIGWTMVPVIILAVLAVPSVAAIFEFAEEPTGDALEVEVIARQWWWEYNYLEAGVVAANEMYIPVGRPVAITLKSEDVIHSFWVPKLGGKQDVVPGHVNHMVIEASAPGEYFGQCAEYCGLSHANMRLRVFAVPPDEFDFWLQSQKAEAETASGDLAQAGQKLFLEGQCAGCHVVGGTTAQARVGPNLTHFASRTTFAGAMFENNTRNLRAWVRDAPGVKPGSKMPSGIKEMGLSEADIDALVAYLETLK